MSVNIIFRIAAVGILVTILVQVLKHSGRDEQAFLITLAGLILVLGWVIPYIYDLAHECEKTGAPIVRPLVYEYPADKHVRNISDEYMLGSFVLVAPVIAPGKEAREVYLPDGDWYDYYTGEKYSGGRYILADAPLDKVPVFIKAGAIIPVADGEIRSTEDITEDKISILTYPGKGSFVHYQDDNETFAYRDGAYNAVEYTMDGDKLEKRVLHKGL